VVLERSVVSAQGVDPENVKLLGRLLSESGQPDKAIEVYRTAIERVSEPHVKFELGLLLAEQGGFVEATEVFQELLTANPDNLSYRVELGKTLEGSHRYQEAVEVLRGAVAEDPDNMEANYYLASSLRQLGKRDESIALVKHLLQLTAKGGEVALYKGRFKSFLALLYQEVGNYPKAVETFEEIVVDEPTNSRAKLGLVYALEDAGRLDDALELSEELLNSDPGDLEPKDLLITRSRILSAAGKVDEAVEILSVEASQTKDEELYLAMGQVYSEHKLYARAEEFVLQARTAVPESERLQFQLGAVQERQGKLDLAETTFKDILAKNPDHAAVLNYLGYMLADNGERLTEAQRYVERALEIEPHNGAYLDSMGWVYFKLGKLDLAEASLVRALELVDSDATILEHLGDLYLKLGDNRKARDYYKKSIDYAEDPEEREKVEAKLAALGDQLNGTN